MEGVYTAFHRYAGEIISKVDPEKNKDVIELCKELQNECLKVETIVWVDDSVVHLNELTMLLKF